MDCGNKTAIAGGLDPRLLQEVGDLVFTIAIASSIPNTRYVTLSEGKVWVEYDGMEQGITKDLIAAGIQPEGIVLAFLPEEQTAATA